jgi:hypothetical protein
MMKCTCASAIDATGAAADKSTNRAPHRLITTPRKCSMFGACDDDGDDDEDDEEDASDAADEFEMGSEADALTGDEDEEAEAEAEADSDQCVEAAIGTLHPPSSERSNARSAAQHKCVARWSWKGDDDQSNKQFIET